MKAIVCSLFIGLIGFALPAWAEQHKGDANVNVAPRRGHANTAVAAPAKVNVSPKVRSVQSARTSSNVAGTRFTTRTAHNYTTPKVTTNTSVNRNISRTHQTFPQRNVATATKRNITTQQNALTQRKVTTAQRFQARNNVTVNNRNVVTNRNVNRNVTVTNHWNSSRFNGQAYAAFRNYNRQWHNRDWWRNHFHTIVFVSGGWYYWDTGYWYPAWGYAPNAYYPYDGPIYGYASVSLDQEIVNVQTRLQREGYYAGPIDGQLGPMTRQAIAAFQADRGLAITSAIDEPTLDALGLA